MRALHFAALVREQAAPAVQGQADVALRPFTSYLGAALDAAKARQVRYRVSWQKLPNPQRIRLRAMDCLVELRLDSTRYRLEGWPVGVTPNPAEPLMVVSRSLSIPVRAVETTSEGLLVSVEQPLLPEDQVFWGGRSCRLVAMNGARRPTRVFDSDRRSLRFHEPRAGQEPLRLVVEAEVSELFDETGLPLPTQVLEPFTGLTRCVDCLGAVLPCAAEAELELSTLPAEGLLRGDNGVRFAWEPLRGREHKRPGTWVQLLAPEDLDGDAAIDPRAAFCEEGISEVRVDSGRDSRQVLKVYGFKRDSYQLLLEREPPRDSVLHLPIDLKNLRRQMDALGSLRTAPLPHHRGLVRLLEDPEKTDWKPVAPARVTRWYVLEDERSSGTLQQREFVAKALATPDFAFLEGPPGSGKTHAICELILQLLERNLRVLLCSTTHVAVDNVLERLVGRFAQVEAVRIGKVERVDRRVRACQIDERITHLVTRWRGLPSFEGFSDEALADMARGVVLDSVNLTCGTTLGILAHPALRDEEKTRSKHPRFDVLILDETSKTPFQEMLVPALYARRWILVGDVRQLSPFTERVDLEAALRELAPGDRRAQAFSPSHQRACLLLQRLTRRSLKGRPLRWLVTEEPETLSHLSRELCRRAETGASDVAGLEAVRIVAQLPAPPSPRYAEVSVAELERGLPAALRVLGAGLVLVEPGLLPRVERWLAPDLCWIQRERRARQALSLHRREHWRHRSGPLHPPMRERGRSLTSPEELEQHEATFLKERDWAAEVGWRLVRVHELGSARSEVERVRLQKDLDALLPKGGSEVDWVKDSVAAVQDIGLRSALEVLQKGASAQRVRRPNALAFGLPAPVWSARAVLLSHQHRMHPDISAFPRETFYAQKALLDANTLVGREERVGWSFGRELAARRMWSHVQGREVRGVNAKEIQVMRDHLEEFLTWAGKNPRHQGHWEVACLSFYVRQELAIRDMLRSVTGQPRQETRFEFKGVEISSGTVDRFQGREADLVLLSMRNSYRVGFLDSPHRLNVALTRARHLLWVIGQREYFLGCDVEELELLATRSAVLTSERRERRNP